MKESSLNLEKLIKLFLFLYILSLYLFTYQERLFVLSNALALLFVIIVLVKVIAGKSKLVFSSIILCHSIFILICLFSYFYAVNKNNVISDVKTLCSVFIVMIALVNAIDNPDMLEWAIKAFIFSGFISSIYIIVISDLSTAERYGRELGNVNSVGMIIGISLIFCITEFFRQRKKVFLLALIPMLAVILMTGSRKSILLIIFAVLYISYHTYNSSISGRLKFIFLSALFLLLLYYLVMEVPFFYNILGVRIKGLVALLTGKGKVESSAAIRKFMIEVGINLFMQKPLLGYGAKNYSVMFGELTGDNSYAHNNFIELLVNVGIVGTFSYYIGHLKVIKDLLLFDGKIKDRIYIYAFISIILAYFFLGTGLVYYSGKHISFILALASITPSIYSKNRSQSKG